MLPHLYCKYSYFGSSLVIIILFQFTAVYEQHMHPISNLSHCLGYRNYILTYFWGKMMSKLCHNKILIADFNKAQAKKKKMCVYCHMSKKSRVGQSGLFYFFYYRQNRKQSFPVPESDSGISFSKFRVSRHLLKLF